MPWLLRLIHCLLTARGTRYFALRNEVKALESIRLRSFVRLSSWTDNEGVIGRWRAHCRPLVPRYATSSCPAFVACGVKRSVGTGYHGEQAPCGTFRFEGRLRPVYDQAAKPLESAVKEYLLAWAALLDDGSPQLALANTVEVQSLSGRTIGLIVSEPSLARAWHVAYDNLVLHAAFDNHLAPKEIREELSILDGPCSVLFARPIRRYDVRLC